MEIKFTLSQAKRVIAVAPKTSHYYQEALRVLHAHGYFGTPSPSLSGDQTDSSRS
jgi:hypothetical protein